MKHLFLLMLVVAGLLSCNPQPGSEEPTPDDKDKKDTTIVEDTVIKVLDLDDTYQKISLNQTITGIQPGVGLVLWPDLARSKNSTYNKSITLEFSYCLPCRVVTGKKDGVIQYDWSYFEDILDDIASRNHQAVIRFRYEYPSSKEVDGTRGSTAVPQYIKDLPDYEETFASDAGGDGPTYYADWSNEELMWFTKQFYVDFAERYGSDPRIAYLEVGFGHWSEYHIYGTPVKHGVNFPTKEYQKEFFLHLSQIMPIPWLISIDAADGSYTPIVADAELMALHFGLFDDSFMHSGHEIGKGDGYNESCWNKIGKKTRWQTGVCGGEISYYTQKDQREFLNPAGLYGITWEQASAKYHITFMIANDAPGGSYGTAERFKEAGMAVGYKFCVLDCRSNGKETVILAMNEGIAPLYRDAWFMIDGAKSDVSLKGLLPGSTRIFHIEKALTTGNDLTITSPYILNGQTIEFNCPE